MTLQEEFICIVVSIVFSFVVGFSVISYHEKRTANFLEVTVLALAFFVYFSVSVMLLPLKVLFSYNARQKILFNLIQGAEKKHKEEGKLEIKIKDSEIEDLIKVLMSMTSSRFFFKFAFKVNYVYFDSISNVVLSVIQAVSQCLESEKKVSNRISNRIEYRLTDRYNVPFYKECYTVLNLPSL